MRKSTVCLILLLSAIVRPLRPEDKALSLEDALSLALERNPEIAQARYGLEEAKGRRLQAEARPDPNLALSTEGIPFRLRTADTTEINLGLEQPFEFPGKRSLRSKIGRYGEDIASLELDRIRLVVTARVKKAYWNAVLSDRTVASLEALAGLLDSIIESSRVRYQAGAVSYGDVLRARVEKARLLNETIQARRDRETARSELAVLLGGPAEGPFVLTSDLAFVPFDRTLGEVKAAARATRPSLRIASLRAEQAGTAAALAAKNRLPDFSVGLFFPSVRLNAWGVAFGLSLPVSRARTQGERMEAGARHTASLASFEARAMRLDAQLEAAYASVSAAGEQVALFERELLTEMEEELRSGLTQYQYGRIESYRLLDLYRTYSAAQLERLKALFLYLSGLADLEAAGEEG
jgi:cobalt-zinc-cadmium efflux system outer membrane protein